MPNATADAFAPGRRSERPFVPPGADPRPPEPLTEDPPPRPSQVVLRGRTATLRNLAEDAAACRECPIGFHATQTVWGEGHAQAPLMLVGEQPGDQEDLAGRPFVGPAGRLLDRALAELGWPREKLYVTNAVKHFKHELRGKRRMHKTPGQREATACLHWLNSEIAAVRPRAIIALGATAARSLLGRAVPVMQQRGQWQQRDDGTPVLVTLHPSALLRLRSPDREQAFERWLEDLRQATAEGGRRG